MRYLSIIWTIRADVFVLVSKMHTWLITLRPPEVSLSVINKFNIHKSWKCFLNYLKFKIILLKIFFQFFFTFILWNFLRRTLQFFQNCPVAHNLISFIKHARKNIFWLNGIQSFAMPFPCKSWIEFLNSESNLKILNRIFKFCFTVGLDRTGICALRSRTQLPKLTSQIPLTFH